jgi:hypothetical protein
MVTCAIMPEACGEIMEMWWRDSGDWASKVIQGGVIRMFKYANDQVCYLTIGDRGSRIFR